MKNLKKLGITNTDIDSGLEYLAESKLETFATEWYPWDTNVKFSGKIKEAKAEKLFAELRPYAIDLKKGKYDFSAWKNAKLIITTLEKEQLENQLTSQKNQIDSVIKNLKVVGNEFLIKKKEELETLVNSIKEKIDTSLHGYLEIFLDAQTGSNTIEIIKRNLVNKLDEQELSNLQNQDQQQTRVAQIIQLSPKK